MKKIITTIIFVLSIAMIASSCAQSTSEKNSEKISVVSTIFPSYDFAREIGKDNVDVEILLSAGEESHSYEPTAKDIIKIEESDLFIYTGSENDYWVDEVLKSLDESKTKVLKLVDMVEVLEEEHTHDDEEEHTHEDEQEHTHDDEEEHTHTIDEHVWTSPKNAITISTNIATALKEIDETNSQVYQQNLDEYVTKLNELDNAFSDVVSTAKRNTIVVGDRFPFRYLANDYQIEYYSAFDSCQTESDASPKTIASLIETVTNENIPVVLKMEMSNGNIADTIANDTNTKVLQMHSCHNLTKEEWDNKETYLSLMQKNVEILREALN